MVPWLGLTYSSYLPYHSRLATRSVFIGDGPGDVLSLKSSVNLWLSLLCLGREESENIFKIELWSWWKLYQDFLPERAEHVPKSKSRHPLLILLSRILGNIPGDTGPMPWKRCWTYIENSNLKLLSWLLFNVNTFIFLVVEILPRIATSIRTYLPTWEVIYWSPEESQAVSWQVEGQSRLYI